MFEFGAPNQLGNPAKHAAKWVHLVPPVVRQRFEQPSNSEGGMLLASSPRTNRGRLRCTRSVAVFLAAAVLASDVVAQAGDVFNSNSNDTRRSGGGNTTRRTGKQATQDDS